MVDHRRGISGQKDYEYERDTVKKEVRVKELDESLRVKKAVQKARMSARSVSRKSRENLTESRYMLPREQQSNCHRRAHEGDMEKEEVTTGEEKMFQPLRRKSN